MDASLFGARLRELRAEAGLSQSELAERMGLTQGSIGHLETGRREATWSTVITLAKALGVTCAAFCQPPKKGAEESKQGRAKKAAK